MNNDSASIFEIDKYDLDNECSKQPVLHVQYSEELADAEKELFLMESELATNVRSRIDEKGKLENIKATESWIESVMNRNDAYLEMKRKVSILKGKVKSLDKRPQMIDCLCRLNLAGYYGSTSFTQDGEKIDGKKEYTSRELIKSSSKRRVKKGDV